jgi:flagellar biosynthesis chaperone FliJ
MKALFETLTIGREGEKINLEGKAEIDRNDAIKMQRFLTELIQEIEQEQRNKLPFWRRFWS